MDPRKHEAQDPSQLNLPPPLKKTEVVVAPA